MVERILGLWEASLVYRGARLNAESRLADAGNLYADAEVRLQRFARGSPGFEQRMQRFTRHRTVLAHEQMDAKLVRESIDLSRKRMRSERDLRRRNRSAWEDQV